MQKISCLFVVIGITYQLTSVRADGPQIGQHKGCAQVQCQRSHDGMSYSVIDGLVYLSEVMNASSDSDAWKFHNRKKIIF